MPKIISLTYFYWKQSLKQCFLASILEINTLEPLEWKEMKGTKKTVNTWKEWVEVCVPELPPALWKTEPLPHP